MVRWWGFNPRPALLPGESRQHHRAGGGRKVSIHARHCCRANHGTWFVFTRLYLFQSTPGIAAGRIHVRRRYRDSGCCFNPRPALLPGESLWIHPNTVVTMFQSTPGIAAGRIGSEMPKPCGGAVSIHARHCCRANPGAMGRMRCSLACFNPRPALLPGESTMATLMAPAKSWFQSTPGIAAGRILGNGTTGLAKLVSIHARHCCRANPPPAKPPPCRRPCFNPRPALLPGESNTAHLIPTIAVKFQSTPGIAAGRIDCPVKPIWRRPCFNPRPALLPGESVIHSLV